MTAPVIVASNLAVSYGKDEEVLSGITFELEASKVHGLVGANGVGKTTLLGAIAGQLPFTGSLSVFGADPFDNLAVMDCTIVVSTHHLNEVSNLLDTVLLIDDSGTVLAGAIDDLTEAILEVIGSNEAVSRFLAAVDVAAVVIYQEEQAGSTKLKLDLRARQSMVNKVYQVAAETGVKVTESTLESAVLTVAIVDYLVHSASAFGAYLVDLGSFTTAFIVVGAVMGNFNPRKILGQWLLYGNNRKPWMWFTVVATAVYGLIITFLCMGLLWLTAYFADQAEAQQFSYSIWLLCALSFIIFPLRETVLTAGAKTYYPVVVVASCVIMMIVLGMTGVATGLGQLLVAIVVYVLWAADFLRRAKSMAPEYMGS